MVCDDSAVARKMAIRCLPAALQGSVQQAENGREALAHLASEHFDLLLLDLTMPECDGITVLDEIRARRYEVFVLVVSGDIQPQRKQAVKKFNTLGFLNKPVCAKQVCHILKSKQVATI